MLDIPVFYPNFETNEPFSVILICEFVTEANYCIHRKKTKLYCFDFVIDGKQCVYDNNKTYYVKENDFCIIKGNAPQLFYTDKKTNHLHKLSICVQGEFIQSLLNLYDVQNVVYHNIDCKYIMYSLLDFAIKNQSNYKKVCMQTAISLQQIFMLLSPQNNKEEEIPEIFLHIKNLLDSKLYDRFNDEELCNTMHISKSHMIKYFKKYFHCTPYNYLMNKKLEHAKILLQSTSKPIKDIALQLKFTDEHYFSYYFKQKTKMSPSQYRQLDF